MWTIVSLTLFSNILYLLCASPCPVLPTFSFSLRCMIWTCCLDDDRVQCCRTSSMSQPVVMGKRIVGRPRRVTVGQGGVESGRGGLHCCCCTCCTCINLQFLWTVEGRLKLCEVVSWAPAGARTDPLGAKIHQSSYRAVNTPRHVHTVHYVCCEQHCRLSAPTNVQFYILFHN
jgi:hypothetical protein